MATGKVTSGTKKKTSQIPIGRVGLGEVLHNIFYLYEVLPHCIAKKFYLSIDAPLIVTGLENFISSVGKNYHSAHD